MFTPPNITSDNGDSFIPASQRPDGTWRKARRVKEGYVPQEEVPLYESKGKQFMSKVTQPQTVVLSSGKVAHQTIPGLFIVDKKEKKASKKSKKVPEVNDICLKLQSTGISLHQTVTPKDNKKKDKKSIGESDLEPSPEKKIKNLKKKVREIEALEEKLKNGTITNPEPEQLQKVKRKNDLLMQIHQMEKSLE